MATFLQLLLYLLLIPTLSWAENSDTCNLVIEGYKLIPGGKLYRGPPEVNIVHVQRLKDRAWFRLTGADCSFQLPPPIQIRGEKIFWMGVGGYWPTKGDWPPSGVWVLDMNTKKTTVIAPSAGAFQASPDGQSVMTTCNERSTLFLCNLKQICKIIFPKKQAGEIVSLKGNPEIIRKNWISRFGYSCSSSEGYELLDWARDSRYFWFASSEAAVGILIDLSVVIDGKEIVESNRDIDKDWEYAINFNRGWIAHSTFPPSPGRLEAPSAKEKKEYEKYLRKTDIELKISDFFTEKTILVTKLRGNEYRPQWGKDDTLIYRNGTKTQSMPASQIEALLKKSTTPMELSNTWGESGEGRKISTSLP